MKKYIFGIATNLSNNPFRAVTGKRYRTSPTLSFDLNFDICDQGGNLTHVWFFRSFRLPPSIEDGDPVEVVGKYGRLLGLIGRKNLYATKIIDRKRNILYTPWRNRSVDEESIDKIVKPERKHKKKEAKRDDKS